MTRFLGRQWSEFYASRDDAVVKSDAIAYRLPTSGQRERVGSAKFEFRLMTDVQ